MSNRRYKHLIQKGCISMYDTYDDIVVTPVPAGETVVCERR